MKTHEGKKIYKETVQDRKNKHLYDIKVTDKFFSMHHRLGEGQLML